MGIRFPEIFHDMITRTASQLAGLSSRIAVTIRRSCSSAGGIITEDRAGLYATAVFHLIVLIVLLAGSIGSAVSNNASYLFDFSRQEEEELNEQEQVFKEEISRRIDRLLSDGGDIGLPPEPEIRNIAVDASSRLQDDRNTDAEKLYSDAERLQQELKNGYRQDFADEDMRNETVDMSATDGLKSNDTDDSRQVYRGPSVADWRLEGRKPSILKIPAYRCIGGGEVTVAITVDNSGRIINAKVIDNVSSDDECLRNFAIRAARMSRFSASRTAPARQAGEIVYRFIAQ